MVLEMEQVIVWGTSFFMSVIAMVSAAGGLLALFTIAFTVRLLTIQALGEARKA